MNSNLKFKGQFFSLLKGGEKLGWAVMLCRDNETGEKYSVYCTNNIPMLRRVYDIELKKTPKNHRLISFFDIPLNIEGDIATFIANNTKGIGLITAEKIVNKYGKNVLEVFKENESKIDESLNENQAESIRELLKNYVYSEEDILFFKEHNLFAFYEKLKKVYPLKNISYISEFKKTNVYELYILKKMPIEEVDKFALALGYSDLCFQRKFAFIIFSIRSLETENDTLFTVNSIHERVCWYIELSFDEFLENLITLQKKQEIFMKEIDGIMYVSTAETFNKELYVYKKIKKLQKEENKILDKKISINSLDSFQKTAFKTAFSENVSIVSGGPGTGKTFLIKSFVEALKKSQIYDNEGVFVLTPTGRTASNIASKTQIKARTIHSFLGISTSEEECVFTDLNIEKWNKAKVLIIDEFSMVNLELFYKLLYNCKKIQKLILIGDYNQLPAIGLGNILYDLVNSKLCKTTFLNNNYRIESQKIFDHYNAINEGLAPPFKEGIVDFFEANLDFFDEEISGIFSQKIKKYGLDNVVVLAPTYKWTFGLVHINNVLQNLVNKNSEVVTTKIEQGTEVFYKIGDKIMQQINRNEENIYNGDIGYIIKQTTEKKDKQTIKTIYVSFKGIVDENGEYQESKTIKYKEQDFKNEVNLAYATTIHKFQGSEIEAVIMTINKKHEFMLSKKLLYTGVSRTKKDLTIFGEKSFYINLIQKVHKKHEKIFTNLKYFLLDDK